MREEFKTNYGIVSKYSYLASLTSVSYRIRLTKAQVCEQPKKLENQSQCEQINNLGKVVTM